MYRETFQLYSGSVTSASQVLFLYHIYRQGKFKKAKHYFSPHHSDDDENNKPLKSENPQANSKQTFENYSNLNLLQLIQEEQKKTTQNNGKNAYLNSNSLLSDLSSKSSKFTFKEKQYQQQFQVNHKNAFSQEQITKFSNILTKRSIPSTNAMTPKRSQSNNKFHYRHPSSISINQCPQPQQNDRKERQQSFLSIFSIEDINETEERQKRTNSRSILIPDIKQSFGSIAIDSEGIKKVNEYIIKSELGKFNFLFFNNFWKR